MTEPLPKQDLLHDWSNNNLDLDFKGDGKGENCKNSAKGRSKLKLLQNGLNNEGVEDANLETEKIRNGNGSSGEESALESVRSMTLHRKVPHPDEESSNPKISAEETHESEGFLDDLEGIDSDQESHTSSLESAPESGGKNLSNSNSRNGYCSEEELGSSTSCSVDSFEITSPFNTLSLQRTNSKDDKRATTNFALNFEDLPEEITPKVEEQEVPRFELEECGEQTNKKPNTQETEKDTQCSSETSGDAVKNTTGSTINFQRDTAISGIINGDTQITTQNSGETGSAVSGSTNSGTVAFRSSVRQNSGSSERSSLLDAAKIQSIHEELSQLDTGMPTLDFSKLEQQLNTAAKEREMSQRKMMFEEVRKRLAMDPEENSSSYAYPPMPATRPAKSNLAKRLQSGKNLQVCYMNDGILSDDDDDDGTSESCSGADTEDEFGNYGVPKSKSTPNLSGRKGFLSVGRSTSVADNSKRASELRKDVEEREAEQVSSHSGRQAKLEAETRFMLAKAKQAARMQMEVERQTKSSKSYIEEIVGIPLCKRRLTRPQVMKMSITQLQLIVNDLMTKIESLNEELVNYLVDRDNLHMEQDSMLVDVEDLLQHQSSENLPGFLVQAPHESKPSKFRIFKR